MDALFQHSVLLYLLLYRHHYTLPDTLYLDTFWITALLKLLYLQNINHLCNNFLKIPNLRQSLFELLFELLSLIVDLGRLW